ncbi:hypothetical protein pgond44_10969 [Psychroflexus gondwanensis ACAM 44]|jgi:hypothetical protein|uniref:Glycosyltransferase n=1 Tax=Psychroflexus gondwanensis ACAM 44 TaxID=1189619 RepID=N1WXR0_9FLAO|nr:hypothetical protein [Psychroflexus gondwanensis]EMY80663.1 hypothetical protein pgond44_10969 [Psychroflexus gondwanensis ACAM 44]
MIRKILFISWDGPQTTYLESLFFPIFNQIQKHGAYEFHVMQFTWADKEKKEVIEASAKKAEIKYTSEKVYRKPLTSAGSLFTIFKGIKILKHYINFHKIDILMPRSSLPAMMVNRLNIKGLKVIFDADGMPLMERIEFSGLPISSIQYKILKKEESKLINSANAVIVRSNEAINMHTKQHHLKTKINFFVVLNGRDQSKFIFNKKDRERIRKDLGYQENEKVFVYCGSLDGNKYDLKLMIKFFIAYKIKNSRGKLLILSSSYINNEDLPANYIEDINIMEVKPYEVPFYLSAADIALGFIKPTRSMKAVSAIKLGEYLLMGLPVIFSKGIGNSGKILNNLTTAYLYDYKNPNSIKEATIFAENIKGYNLDTLRDIGINYFSLEKSSESYLKVLDQL